MRDMTDRAEQAKEQDAWSLAVEILNKLMKQGFCVVPDSECVTQAVGEIRDLLKPYMKGV
jgi:hypothetical protein